MANDDSAPPDPASVGGFQIEDLVAATSDVRVYRARDEGVERRVLLHVAGAAGAGTLLEDARRIAAVSHPGLVAVLAASRSDSGAYAAVQDPGAPALGDAGRLSEEDAMRVARDVAGALEALAGAGLRALVDPSTVLVARGPDGARGLLDPLRSSSPGRSCLAPADAHASTRELTDLLEASVPAPSDALRRALDGVRSGVLATPADLAAALAPAAAPRRVGRRAAVAAVACVLVAAVAVLAYTRSTGSHPDAARKVPVARILARTPLGLPAGTIPFSPVVLGRSVWIATSANTLIHVDARTNEVVGSPIALGKDHPLSSLVASGGMLYASDYAGWLQRVDPRNGRVTGRRRLGTSLTAAAAAGGTIWVASALAAKSVLVRVDPATLRPLGRSLGTLPGTFHIDVRGSRIWVLGGATTGEVARIDTATGRRAVVFAGPQITTASLAGDTLWISDRFDGTVSPLDVERMAFRHEAVQAHRAARGVVTVAGDVWITASDALTSTGLLRLERIDAASRRRAGRPVALGHVTDYGLVYGLGSLWELTERSLVRLAPTTPRPPLASPAPPPRRPRALIPGPLSAGTWRSAGFAAPFTLSLPAFAWLAVFPLRDGATFQATGNRQAELDFSAPRQVFTTDKDVRPVGGPASLVAVLQRNPHLRVAAVRRVTVGGRAALQFELRAVAPPRHPEVCGPSPCTLLFPVQESTIAVAAGDVVRMSLLRSAGRTVVVIESGDGDDPLARATTARLLRSVRFAR